MCARCSEQLASQATITSLAAAVDGAQLAAAKAQHPLASEDRQAVAEGLARLASGLPPAEAASAATAIVSPLLQRLQQLMSSSGAQVNHVASSVERQASHTAGLHTDCMLGAISVVDLPRVSELKALAMRDAGSEPGQDAARAAAQELSVLATVFKHLEFAKGCAVNGQPHPATHLLQTAYPTLNALLQQQVRQHVSCLLPHDVSGCA